MKVKELMSTSVITVAPEATVKEVAALLVEHRISGVPVVGANGEVLGVVSEGDILVKERGAERESRMLQWLLGGQSFEIEKLEARTASEAMTAPAITIGANKDAYQAARLMTDERVKRLPVVDQAGRLIGLVTRSDLVKAFARADDDVEREIEDMVLRTLWIEDANLQIHVDEGQVRLSGKLKRRTDAELLPQFVSRVPGVVSVKSTLRWEWDDRKTSVDHNRRVPVTH
jgi:CBS domain-containing protein